MTITSEVFSIKVQPKSSCSTTASKRSHTAHQKQTTKDDSGTESKRSKSKSSPTRVSPYLKSDRIMIITKAADKKSSQRKPMDYASSFSLADSIYRANSDEFRLAKRGSKKVKKSVHTLPNEPLVKPEITVSDMNDSEYLEKDDKDRKYKNRKRFPVQTQLKPRVRNNKFEFYDRDARYINIDIDSSSNEQISDDYNENRKSKCKKSKLTRMPQNEELIGRNVWAALRNMNRFQFRPSPPISEESIPVKGKKKTPRKRNSRNTTRVIKTRRTEEFALISSFDVENKSRSGSQSSCDRITVINKKDEFNEFYKEFENVMSKARHLNKDGNRVKAKNKKTSNSKMKQAEYQNKSKNNAEEIENKNDSKKQIHRIEYKQSERLPITNSDTFTNHPKLNESNLEESAILLKEKGKSLRNVDSGDCKDTFYSGHSGSSSKAAFYRSFPNKREKISTPKLSQIGSTQLMKGITKVLIKKSQDEPSLSPTPTLHTPVNVPVRKPRLVTTMPSITTPKMTQTDIRRRLVHMRFPITVLGKDQICSATIKVESIDDVQFQGLNERMWPFMRNWYENKLFHDKELKVKTDYHANGNLNDRIERNRMKTNIQNNMQLIKPTAARDKRIANGDNLRNKKKLEPKQTSVSPERNLANSQLVKKIKPIRQLKDKLLKLLCKNSSAGNVTQNEQRGGQGDTRNHRPAAYSQKMNIKKNDTSTQTVNNLNKSLRKPIGYSAQLINMRYPWGKAKWANDFIDNVMKKIKNGIYYSQERGKKIQDLKEVAIQADLNLETSTKNKEKMDQMIPRVVIEAKKPPLKIPGFDEAMSPVEIKTFNTKEISVKHCLTNVMVQFDVTQLTELEEIGLPEQKSSSFVSLAITENDTRIFKCKTTIINAILPAEICCILPKMMRNVIDMNANMQLDLPSILPEEERGSPMSTICELPCETVNICEKSIIPFIITSTKLKELVKGTFSNTSLVNRFVPGKRKIRKSFSLSDIIDLFEKDRVVSIFYCKVNTSASPIFLKQHNDRSHKPNRLEDIKTSSSTVLQPYIARQQNLPLNIFSNNYMDIMTKLSRYVVITNGNITSLPSCLPEISNYARINVYNNPCDTHIVLEENATPKKITITVSNFLVEQFFNGCLKNEDTKPKAVLDSNEHDRIMNRCIELDKPQRKSERKYNHIPISSNTKSKRKCYSKLYRKCKSTSNIPEKSFTSLTKIANLDDFCQVLGFGKCVTSVFDGSSGDRIMNCLIEMKNWISEISQRQAMLILLLTNKKDTSNLVRFRPILLQGIAVNRITRVAELEMEIEVIERENLNKLSQYEGIMSYLTTTEENNEHLLEEMYWIAKTTASDYQRPFNESSERLLKSLLAKRKRLSPSYLRVMARYVGLGLLKMPKNTK